MAQNNLASTGTQGEPLVSIVVPTYNTADFLEQCLESIAAQTLKDIEVICVNDGSTDDSLAIMERFAARDSRFRVIDKPNGGYGHSCNRGLSEARGEYVTIVEPDDFISPHMYQDLYEAAKMDDGRMAEIVKSSYWLYYDEGDAMEEHILAPNIMPAMPAYKHQVNFAVDAEMLYHHPSIWSAIYRRDFIQNKGIRFIEPKGAGWADNPFFFETLLQADTIIWIPGAYYYYRQTNPNASSNLKDRYLPLLRLQDIQEVYRRLGIDNPQVLTALYNRAFCYFKDSLFCARQDEHDEDLMALIRGTLGFMDQKVLFEAKKRIKAEWRLYYNEIANDHFVTAGTKSHGAVANPLFSIVLYTYNDRALAKDSLNSLLQQSFDNFEIICVDCASKDYALRMFQQYAEIDKRITVLEIESESFTEARQAGLAQARGTYTCFLNAGYMMPKNYLSSLANALASDACKGTEPDIIKGVKRHHLLGYAASTSNPAEEEKSFPPPRMIEVEGNEAELFVMRATTASAAFFNTEFLRRHKLADDTLNDPLGETLVLRSLEQADKALVVGTKPIDVGKKPSHYRPNDFAEDLQNRFAHLDEIHSYVNDMDNPAFQRVFYSYALEYLDQMLQEADAEDEAAVYFHLIRSKMFDDLKLAELPPSLFANAGLYNALVQALSYSYANYLQRDMQRHRQGALRIAANKKNKKKNEITPRTVAAKAAKTILPDPLVQQIRGALKKRRDS